MKDLRVMRGTFLPQGGKEEEEGLIVTASEEVRSWYLSPAWRVRVRRSCHLSLDDTGSGRLPPSTAPPGVVVPSSPVSSRGHVSRLIVIGSVSVSACIAG